MDIYSVSKRGLSGSKGKKSGNKDKKNTRRRVKRTKRMRTKRNSKRVSRRRNVKNVKRRSRRQTKRRVNRSRRRLTKRTRRVMRGGAPFKIPDIFGCGDYKCLSSYDEIDHPEVPFDGFFRTGTKPTGMCVHINWTERMCTVIKFNDSWRGRTHYSSNKEELDDLFEYQYRNKEPPQWWLETGQNLIETNYINIDDFCVYGAPEPSPDLEPELDPSPETAPVEVLPAPSTFTSLDLATRDKPVEPDPEVTSFPAVRGAIQVSEPSPDMKVESVESVESVDTARVPLGKLRAVSGFVSESPATASPPETAPPISLSTLTKVATAFVSPFHKETVERMAADDAEGIPENHRDNFRTEGITALASLIKTRKRDRRKEISPEMLHFIISLRAFNTPFMITKKHSKTRGNILEILKKCNVEARLSKFIKRLFNHVCGIKDPSTCDILISEIQSLCPAESLKDSVLIFFNTFAYSEPID